MHTISLKALMLCVSFCTLILVIPAFCVTSFAPENRDGVYWTVWCWLGGWLAGGLLHLVLQPLRSKMHPELVMAFERNRVASVVLTLVSLLLLALGIFLAGLTGKPALSNVFIWSLIFSQFAWQCYLSPKPEGR